MFEMDRVTSTAKSMLGTAVKDASVVLDRLMPAPEGIVVLLYHRVGVGSGSPIDLSVEAFDRQMAVLASAHRVISLDAAAAELAGGGVVDPGVVVTFDDGTVDFVDHALPVLVRHAVPATLYVATGLVDSADPWPDGGVPISKQGLREAASSDLVTLGSHTHTHKLLDRLPADQIAGELDRSIDALGDWCGIEARHFAYPKAVAPSSAAAALVAERFATAALAEPGANGADTDPQRLRRTPIQATDRPRHLDAKFAGGMAFESLGRSVLNRARYRGRSS